MTTIDILKKTKAAWKHINNASAETKNALLLAMADSLERNRAVILVENRADMEAARGHISDVMLDRLYLDEKRLAAMAEGVRPSRRCRITRGAFSRRCTGPTA